MGCNCSNLLREEERGVIYSEEKVNNDFFLDYGIKQINTSTIEEEKIIIEGEDIFNSNNDTKDSRVTRPLHSNNFQNLNLEQNKNKKKSKEKYHNNSLYRYNIGSNLKKSRKILYSSEIEANYFVPITNTSNNRLINENELNEIPEDNYCSIILRNINILRENPTEIAELIEENKKYIFIENNNEIYFKKNRFKIKLNKGLKVFENTIKLLKTIKSINKIIYRKKISIDLPKNEQDIENLNYLQDEDAKLEYVGEIIISFWREKIRDPNIAFIMMIVDDNPIETGLKRKDLLNPNIKYIGISSIEINKHFACFLTLMT